MNEIMRSTVGRTLSQGIRDVRRDLLSYRPVELKTGISANAEGSAHVKIGTTEVFVGVKLAVERPYPDTPDKGMLAVNTELLPLSSPEFETGPPAILAIELSRVVDRGIRESGYLDMDKLNITPGEESWSIFIDICTLNSDGNLFDAAALGALVALRDAKFPKREGKKLNYKEHKGKLPLKEMPISVTVLKIGSHLLVDPDREEEEVYDARLTVAVLPDGNLCALQKGGDAPLSFDDIERMVSIAQDKSKELRKLVESVR